ncbi:MAG: acyl-ACP--UDP-N-acetylglucosamine O-acyltransferase [Planctomycetia bacterium]|nr:acyl-ACP--UDP-N-acetylglucosamine O-acyltransferase [Planctomycetia bacterium]
MKIHPSAIISKDAKIASDVEIGPFCVVESGVTMESGCRLLPRVVIKKGVTLGENNIIHEGAVLGGIPQHTHLSGEIGGVIIGSGNTFRENATVHCAMYPDKCTRIGDNNFLMVNSHVAHDCVIGNHTILTNNTMLAGHVLVEDRAFISGGVAVHQFCRIGMFAMVGGTSLVVHDVPPFVTVDGGTSLVVGLNSIGLRRAGVPSKEIRKIREAYDVLYASVRPWEVILSELREKFTEGLASHFAVFLEGSSRGFVQERRKSGKSLKLVRTEEAPQNTGLHIQSEDSDDQALKAI